MTYKVLNFIHISDTHIGPSKDFKLREITPYKSAQRIINAVSALPFKPAFVIHTGDVVADPDEGAYALVKELFSALEIPVRYVVGNHDDGEMMRNILPSAAIDNLSPNPKSLSYSFSHNEHRFVTLHANNSEPFWSGKLPQEQLDFLDDEIAKNPASLTLFLHFPPLSMNVEWLDKKMMLVNGDQLHTRLKSLPSGTVKGVFSGHIHRGVSVTRDGILYQSGPSTAHQFITWPNQPDLEFAVTPPPAFNLVTYLKDSTVVQPHAVLS